MIVSPFSHLWWEKVAEGRMKAALRSKAVYQLNRVRISHQPLGGTGVSASSSSSA
jgi:hypothetical protein